MKTKVYKILFRIIILMLIMVFITPAISIAQDDNNNQDNQDNQNDNDNNGNNQNNENDNDWFNNNDLFDDVDEDDFIDDENNDNNENQNNNNQDDSTPVPVYDLLNIGGSLNLDFPVNVGEFIDDEAFLENTYIIGTPLNSMIYLSSRPNETLRSYIEFDLGFTPRYYDKLFTNDWVAQSFNVELDEMFLDINAGYKLFMRIGKQNIKWGAGYRWSPTDFINKERKDPLEPESDRNGITGLKFTLPMEPFNFIAFIGLEGLADVTETPITLRAEFAYKFFEITATTYVKQGKIPQYGFDYALGDEFWGGTWELNGEISYSYGSNNMFIGFDPDRPGVNPADPEFLDLLNDPETTDEELLNYFIDHAKFYPYYITDEHILKTVVGLTYTTSKLPEWLSEILMINVEYYYNGEGYNYPETDDEGNEINIIPYTIFYNALVETGRHYLGVSILSTNPFTIDDFSFNVNYILNMTDFSSIMFASFSYSGVDRLSMSAYLKMNFGEEGTEYYFASPITIATFFQNLMDNLDFETQEIISYEDVLQEYFTIGLRLGVKF